MKRSTLPLVCGRYGSTSSPHRPRIAALARDAVARVSDRRPFGQRRYSGGLDRNQWGHTGNAKLATAHDSAERNTAADKLPPQLSLRMIELNGKPHVLRTHAEGPPAREARMSRVRVFDPADRRV